MKKKWVRRLEKSKVEDFFEKNTISAIPDYIFSFLKPLLVGLWLKIEYKKIKVVVVVYTHIREQVVGSCKPEFVI